MTYADAMLAARAAKAERCISLSRDALAAGIALGDAPPTTSFDTFQKLEYDVLVAVAAWAAAFLEPVVIPGPTALAVQELPEGYVLPQPCDPLDPDTYPPHLRSVDS